MIRKGNSRAAGLAITLALASFGLIGCGSGGGETTATAPALSAATAGHLAKLSDRVASDLDAGDTCDAAHVADDLLAAVEEADLPAPMRAGVGEVAGRLVDEVNCPPPPPPPEPKKKEKKPKEEHGKHGDHGGKLPIPLGHVDHGGGFVPPGQAKIGGEEG